MPSANQMSWDAAADRKLLLGILKMHDVKVDFDAMAAYMSTGDVACTTSAIQNRIKKLRSLAKEAGECIDDAGTPTAGTPKAKATPRKRKAAAATDSESPSKKAKSSNTVTNGIGPGAMQYKDGNEGPGHPADKKEAD